MTENQINVELLRVLAALNSEDRKIVLDYFNPLLGGEFASDMTKDYEATGQTKTVQAHNLQLEKLSALSPETRQTLKDYWKKLEGEEFASDMVEDQEATGVTKEVKAAINEAIKAGMPKKLAERLARLTPSEATSRLQHLGAEAEKKS